MPALVDLAVNRAHLSACLFNRFGSAADAGAVMRLPSGKAFLHLQTAASIQ
jgi:hypothetical protein